MAALFSPVPFSLNVTEFKMPITEVVRVNLMAALISSLTVMVIAKISSWLGNSQTVGFILRRYWKDICAIVTCPLVLHRENVCNEFYCIESIDDPAKGVLFRVARRGEIEQGTQRQRKWART